MSYRENGRVTHFIGLISDTKNSCLSHLVDISDSHEWTHQFNDRWTQRLRYRSIQFTLKYSNGKFISSEESVKLWKRENRANNENNEKNENVETRWKLWKRAKREET